MDFSLNFDPQMLSGAGIVFVVGFGIVFIVLILLILVLSLQAKAFASIGGRKKAPKAAPKAAPAPVPAPAPAPVPAAQEDEEEIAAVIAAVVAMYAESGNGLVVRQVRRVGANAPAWNLSGRQEYVNTRY